MRCGTSLFVAMCLVFSCGGRQSAGKSDSPRTPAKKYRYGGGEGDSYETAVVIENAASQRETFRAEYAYISSIHGEQEKAWEVAGQSRTKESDRTYDVVEIRLLPSGDPRYYYFDVTGISWQAP